MRTVFKFVLFFSPCALGVDWKNSRINNSNVKYTNILKRNVFLALKITQPSSDSTKGVPTLLFQFIYTVYKRKLFFFYTPTHFPKYVPGRGGRARRDGQIILIKTNAFYRRALARWFAIITTIIITPVQKSPTCYDGTRGTIITLYNITHTQWPRYNTNIIIIVRVQDYIRI